jgi:hypothetical protein
VLHFSIRFFPNNTALFPSPPLELFLTHLFCCLKYFPTEYFRKLEQNRERWAFVPYRDLVEDVGITVLGLLRRLGYHMGSESVGDIDCPDNNRSRGANDFESKRTGGSNTSDRNSSSGGPEEDVGDSGDDKCEAEQGAHGTDNNIYINNNNNNDNSDNDNYSGKNNSSNDNSDSNSDINDYENTVISSATPHRPPVATTPSCNGSSSGYTPNSSHTASTNNTRSENEKYFPYNLSSEFLGQVPKYREFEKLSCLLELENEKKGVCNSLESTYLTCVARFISKADWFSNILYFSYSFFSR